MEESSCLGLSADWSLRLLNQLCSTNRFPNREAALTQLRKLVSTIRTTVITIQQNQILSDSQGENEVQVSGLALSKATLRRGFELCRITLEKDSAGVSDHHLNVVPHDIRSNVHSNVWNGRCDTINPSSEGSDKARKSNDFGTHENLNSLESVFDYFVLFKSLITNKVLCTIDGEIMEIIVDLMCVVSQQIMTKYFVPFLIRLDTIQSIGFHLLFFELQDLSQSLIDESILLLRSDKLNSFFQNFDVLPVPIFLYFKLLILLCDIWNLNMAIVVSELPPRRSLVLVVEKLLKRSLVPAIGGLQFFQFVLKTMESVMSGQPSSNLLKLFKFIIQNIHQSLDFSIFHSMSEICFHPFNFESLRGYLNTSKFCDNVNQFGSVSTRLMKDKPASTTRSSFFDFISDSLSPGFISQPKSFKERQIEMEASDLLSFAGTCQICPNVLGLFMTEGRKHNEVYSEDVWNANGTRKNLLLETALHINLINLINLKLESFTSENLKLPKFGYLLGRLSGELGINFVFLSLRTFGLYRPKDAWGPTLQKLISGQTSLIVSSLKSKMEMVLNQTDKLTEFEIALCNFLSQVFWINLKGLLLTDPSIVENFIVPIFEIVASETNTKNNFKRLKTAFPLNLKPSDGIKFVSKLIKTFIELSDFNSILSSISTFIEVQTFHHKNGPPANRQNDQQTSQHKDVKGDSTLPMNLSFLCQSEILNSCYLLGVTSTSAQICSLFEYWINLIEGEMDRLIAAKIVGNIPQDGMTLHQNNLGVVCILMGHFMMGLNLSEPSLQQLIPLVRRVNGFLVSFEASLSFFAELSHIESTKSMEILCNVGALGYMTLVAAQVSIYRKIDSWLKPTNRRLNCDQKKEGDDQGITSNVSVFHDESLSQQLRSEMIGNTEKCLQWVCQIQNYLKQKFETIIESKERTNKFKLSSEIKHLVSVLNASEILDHIIPTLPTYFQLHFLYPYLTRKELVDAIPEVFDSFRSMSYTLSRIHNHSENLEIFEDRLNTTLKVVLQTFIIGSIQTQKQSRKRKLDESICRPRTKRTKKINHIHQRIMKTYLDQIIVSVLNTDRSLDVLTASCKEKTDIITAFERFGERLLVIWKNQTNALPIEQMSQILESMGALIVSECQEILTNGRRKSTDPSVDESVGRANNPLISRSETLLLAYLLLLSNQSEEDFLCLVKNRVWETASFVCSTLQYILKQIKLIKSDDSPSSKRLSCWGFMLRRCFVIVSKIFPTRVLPSNKDEESQGFPYYSELILNLQKLMKKYIKYISDLKMIDNDLVDLFFNDIPKLFIQCLTTAIVEGGHTETSAEDSEKYSPSFAENILECFTLFGAPFLTVKVNKNETFVDTIRFSIFQLNFRSLESILTSEDQKLTTQQVIAMSLINQLLQILLPNKLKTKEFQTHTVRASSLNSVLACPKLQVTWDWSSVQQSLLLNDPNYMISIPSVTLTKLNLISSLALIIFNQTAIDGAGVCEDSQIIIQSKKNSAFSVSENINYFVSLLLSSPTTNQPGTVDQRIETNNSHAETVNSTNESSDLLQFKLRLSSILVVKDCCLNDVRLDRHSHFPKLIQSLLNVSQIQLRDRLNQLFLFSFSKKETANSVQQNESLMLPQVTNWLSRSCLCLNDFSTHLSQNFSASVDDIWISIAGEMSAAGILNSIEMIDLLLFNSTEDKEQTTTHTSTDESFGRSNQPNEFLTHRPIEYLIRLESLCAITRQRTVLYRLYRKVFNQEVITGAGLSKQISHHLKNRLHEEINWLRLLQNWESQNQRWGEDTNNLKNEKQIELPVLIHWVFQMSLWSLYYSRMTQLALNIHDSIKSCFAKIEHEVKWSETFAIELLILADLGAQKLKVCLSVTKYFQKLFNQKKITSNPSNSNPLINSTGLYFLNLEILLNTASIAFQSATTIKKNLISETSPIIISLHHFLTKRSAQLHFILTTLYRSVFQIPSTELALQLARQLTKSWSYLFAVDGPTAPMMRRGSIPIIKDVISSNLRQDRYNLSALSCQFKKFLSIPGDITTEESKWLQVVNTIILSGINPLIEILDVKLKKHLYANMNERFRIDFKKLHSDFIKYHRYKAQLQRD